MRPITRKAASRPSRRATPPARTTRPAVAWPAAVLGLQRTLGNQTVQRLLRTHAPSGVLQRSLPEGTKVREVDTGDHALQAIGDDIDAYNRLAVGNPTTASDYQPLFDTLRVVERALYAWFDQVSQQHTLFKKVPATQPLKEFLKEVEREHADLVDQTKDMADLLPFDVTTLGTFPGGTEGLRQLWQDIVNDRGKIHIRGSAAYRKRVLAELAKLLDTDTGRRLLNLLIQRQGPEPTTTEARQQDRMTDVWIGERLDDLPEDVRKLSSSLAEATESKAQPIGAMNKQQIQELTGAVEEAVDGTESDADYPIIGDPTDPAELKKVRDATWSGKQGFRFGGKRYRFGGAGTGAFVTSFPSEGGHASPAGHQVLTPGWVTLGHELGHVANMRAGAATVDLDMPSEPRLTASLAGTSMPEARIYWHDPEEVLNIKNVENALRADVGLTARGSHAGPDTALRVSRFAQLRASLYQGCDPTVDRSWAAVPEFQQIEGAIAVHATGVPKWSDVTDDSKFAGYQERIRSFKTEWTTARLVDWKKQRVRAKHQALVDAYGALYYAWPATQQEYARLDARVRDDLDTVTALGSVEWDNLLGELDDLRWKLRGRWVG